MSNTGELIPIILMGQQIKSRNWTIGRIKEITRIILAGIYSKKFKTMERRCLIKSIKTKRKTKEHRTNQLGINHTL